MRNLAAVAALIALGFVVLRTYGALARLRAEFVAAFRELDRHLTRRHELARGLIDGEGGAALAHPVRAAGSALRLAAADPLAAEGLADLSAHEAALSRALEPFLGDATSLEGAAANRVRDLASAERAAAVACHVVNDRAATYDAARRQVLGALVARLFGFGPAGRVGMSLPKGRDPRGEVGS